MRPIGFNVCTPGGPTAASDGRAAAAAAAAARASRRIASNSFCTCLWRAFICRCSLPISCFAAFSSCCSRRTSALSAAALKVGKDSDINAKCKCKRRSCPPAAAHNDTAYGGKDTERNTILFSQFLAAGAFGFHTKSWRTRWPSQCSCKCVPALADHACSPHETPQRKFISRSYRSTSRSVPSMVPFFGSRLRPRRRSDRSSSRS